MPRAPYCGSMQHPLHDRLDRAREHYAAGAVAEAVSGCVGVVKGSGLDTDPSLVAAAATLIRRPLDPLLRSPVRRSPYWAAWVRPGRGGSAGSGPSRGEPRRVR